MRVGDGLVTVGVMSGRYLADRPAQVPLPARLNDRQWVAAGVLGACAGLAALAVALGPYPHDRAPRLALAALVCCPVILLRRWPLPVLAVAAAATALVATSGQVPLPIGLVLGLAMYFVASRVPRRASIWAALTVAAALGVALAYSAFAVRSDSPAGGVVQSLAPLVAGWFVGDAVAARRRYLAGLAEQEERERAAETERGRQEVREERVRIARELHDVVAHTLTVITVQAGVGRRLMAKRPEQAGAALESIEMIGRTAQDELRVVLGLLRDEQVGAAALAPAPRLADLKELTENVQASGTPVQLRMSGTDRQLSPALELSVYRVVQEALTNVVKHAPGARATVDLAVSDNQVRIEVADDGGAAARSPGEDGQPASPGTGHAILGPGHGIVGMRERIGAFGGWLVAEPLAGRGFRVLAEIPIEGTV
jgi:signal transduction histidine kinase